jgi:hypothetical protein
VLLLLQVLLEEGDDVLVAHRLGLPDQALVDRDLVVLRVGSAAQDHRVDQAVLGLLDQRLALLLDVLDRRARLVVDRGASAWNACSRCRICCSVSCAWCRSCSLSSARWAAVSSWRSMSSTVFSIVSAAPSWYVKTSRALDRLEHIDPFRRRRDTRPLPDLRVANRHPIGALA